MNRTCAFGSFITLALGGAINEVRSFQANLLMKTEVRKSMSKPILPKYFCLHYSYAIFLQIMFVATRPRDYLVAPST